MQAQRTDFGAGRAAQFILLLSLSSACSTPAEPAPALPGSGGGQAGGGAGGSPAAGSGGSAQAGGGAAGTAAGTGGAAGSSGSSGSSGTGGAAGSAGTGGVPGGCEELGTPGNTGRQCDPGTDGDGTFDQPQPDSGTPPEAEGDPAGTLTEEATFQSTLFGYGFRHRIYVPAEYEAGKPAALMVFQDGYPQYGDTFNAPTVIDSLIAAGEMPVTIAVFVWPGNDRGQEYDTRVDKYPKMLLDELLPSVVLNAYDIVDDPNGWAIGGHSSGGSCAFNAGWFFPDKFRKILTNSGSFIDMSTPTTADYIAMVLAEPKQPLRVTLNSGENDLECCGDTWFNANNNIAANLETAGYPYRYMKSTTTHNPNPFGTADFPDAMRWLWKGYTLPHYAAP